MDDLAVKIVLVGDDLPLGRYADNILTRRLPKILAARGQTFLQSGLEKLVQVDLGPLPIRDQMPLR